MYRPAAIILLLTVLIRLIHFYAENSKKAIYNKVVHYCHLVSLKLVPIESLYAASY